jgi:hypothetical protein
MNKNGRNGIVALTAVFLIIVAIVLAFSISGLVGLNKIGGGKISVKPLTSTLDLSGIGDDFGGTIVKRIGSADDGDDDDDDNNGAPNSVSNLASPNKGTNFIYWTWTNPSNSDFAENIIFLNGVNVANTSNAFYNATGLTPSTTYTISVQTKDDDGNINTNSVSNTQATLSISGDTVPPASVTNLALDSKDMTWIAWSWTNPSDSDFAESIIFLDGINVANSTIAFYNATGLSAGSAHTITIHTKDTSGNVNTFDVSNTQTTLSVGGNQAPVVSGMPDVIFNEDESDSSIDLDSFVTDADNTDAEMSWTFSGNTNVIVGIGAGNVVTLTASAEWSGTEFITFRATDPLGAFDEDTISVTVVPVNDAAVWAALTNQNINEDSPNGSVVYNNIVGQCSDVDSAVNVNVLSAHSEFSLALTGVNLIIQNLAKDWYGTRTITMGCNGVTANFDLTVNQLNDDCVTVCSLGNCYTYCG